MFHSCTPAPNNARSKEVQAPAKLKDEDYGEKKAHRGRIDWSPGKCFASPLKRDLFSWARAEGYPGGHTKVNLCVFPTCSFFNWNMIPGSLLPLFNCGQDYAETQNRSTFTFLTKRYNVVLSLRTTRVRVPLARNPSPLQYPTLYVHEYSVRSLLRQPRSALEAGPSEAHAISFVLTPTPRLHPKGYTFSKVFPPLRKEQWAITNWA